MLPPAPAWLSTKTGRANAGDSRSASHRARISITPPGPPATTTRTGLLGQEVSARISPGPQAASPSIVTSARRLVFIVCSGSDIDANQCRQPVVRCYPFPGEWLMRLLVEPGDAIGQAEITALLLRRGGGTQLLRCGPEPGPERRGGLEAGHGARARTWPEAVRAPRARVGVDCERRELPRGVRA